MKRFASPLPLYKCCSCFSGALALAVLAASCGFAQAAPAMSYPNPELIMDSITAGFNLPVRLPGADSSKTLEAPETPAPEPIAAAPNIASPAALVAPALNVPLQSGPQAATQANKLSMKLGSLDRRISQLQSDLNQFVQQLNEVSARVSVTR